MICDWCGGTGVEWTSDKRPTKTPCPRSAGTGWEQEQAHDRASQ